MSKNREISFAIFLTPADPDIRYGNNTIPQVARHAEPLLKPKINESVTGFFFKCKTEFKQLPEKSGKNRSIVVKG